MNSLPKWVGVLAAIASMCSVLAAVNAAELGLPKWLPIIATAISAAVNTLSHSLPGTGGPTLGGQ